MWQKEFLLLSMCQLQALHDFIKRQFFHIYDAKWLTETLIGSRKVA